MTNHSGGTELSTPARPRPIAQKKRLTMANNHPPPNQGLIVNPPRLILLPSVAAIVSDVPICEAILQAVWSVPRQHQRSDEAIVGSL
mmetsp:Transcript_23309/g.38050  ORF Transcript_23309/g.38050 Transcript_23309/m.38050 type:complete len:87 (+) Transcript_23309:91-351(+)